MRGRKPNPENMAAIRPLSLDELPGCPKWLLPDAQMEWDRVVPALAKQVTLTAVDMANLAVYCQTFARWKEAELEIGKLGLMYETVRGEWKRNPAADHALKLLAELRRVAGEFGFSPATRKHVPQSSEGGDELTSFLNG